MAFRTAPFSCNRTEVKSLSQRFKLRQSPYIIELLHMTKTAEIESPDLEANESVGVNTIPTIVHEASINYLASG